MDQKDYKKILINLSELSYLSLILENEMKLKEINSSGMTRIVDQLMEEIHKLDKMQRSGFFGERLP